nr:reverse transcriptase domain-containing protein [Tanacetum cinerariifolium]
MRRVGKGFSGVETPLFENMLAVRDVDEEEEAQVPAQGDEVLDTCFALAHRVEGLENDKAAQQLEIVKLKGRVKKLEKINKGRIVVDMEQDEGIELVINQENDAEVEGWHANKQTEIYNIDLDHSSKVLSMQEDDTEVQEAVEIVTTAKLITEVVTAAATQVVAASTPIPAANPKTLTITAAPAVSTRRRKGVVIRDPKKDLPSDTPAETPKVKDKGKGIWIEAPKPIKKKDQIEMDAECYKMEFFKGKTYDEILPIFQARFDANMKFLFKLREEMEKEDEEIIKSINETPAQKAAKRRKLSEEAQEADDLKKRLEIVQDEDDDVFVEATPLAQKVPVVDYQIVVIDNKPKYKIIIADDTHQFYISFTTLLKNFDREDLETLWRIAVISAEIGMPTLRTLEVDLVGNNEALEINLDILEERREEAAIREAKSKAKIEKYYNSKVQNTNFKPGDLVCRNNDASRAEDTW